MNAIGPLRAGTRPAQTPSARLTSQPDRPRIALVLTREITEEAGFGRVKTLREIHGALAEGFPITELRIHSLVETRRVLDILTAGLSWLRGLLTARPIPLQTILYSGSGEIRRLTKTLSAGNFAAIYLDSVRCQLLLRKIRKRLPDVRIVVDLDDLMSRRMEELSARRIPLSLGFLARLFPATLQWLLQGPLSALVTRYEARALNIAELEAVEKAQAVVLVSSAERDILRQKIPSHRGPIVQSVPPPAVASDAQPAAMGEPLRFVFIGSDRMAQNRLSIDFLVQLWRDLKPAAVLHIYGRQERKLPETPNVRWHGFVQDVATVYCAGSIMLLPGLLPGGIKTKVIEAWSFGCPVLGNAYAFEGLDLPGYPLMQPEAQWAPYVLHPEAHLSAWTSAAQMGHAFVRTTLSPAQYATRWKSLLTP